ncbi:MAG: transporter [Bacillati bacterium ANGP1]|uniref:Transporter n=1 Tax=Candidatus Segetimicrobium genomatis TaxID=2569760 RepID=A0A537JKW9_9BACT|nr:MAG: transporter [Terrabacteria group bacterium ANGP1]
MPVAARAPRIRFDRNELSGAFGDIGTDFPLLVGMSLAAKLDPAGVFTMFGMMQILTGLVYGIPMPAQPLKAVAVLVIAQRIPGHILYGALAATGLLDVLTRVVPKVVVRGIQFGLGIQLSILALRDYVPAEGVPGYVLGGISFVIILLLLGNRRFPPAPLVILLGIGYALLFRVSGNVLIHSAGLHLPELTRPTTQDILTGFLLLALPQIPLSLGNSILATKQIAADLFPERRITTRKIGLTYSVMNLVNPFLGGVPTCHGSGGMAGHYAFGARTGGSVLLYGALYLALGLFVSAGFRDIIPVFPRPVLGVILLFEAVALLRLARDTASSSADFSLVLLIGAMAASLPYGYLVALVLGTIVARTTRRWAVGLIAEAPGAGGDREPQIRRA